MELLEDDECFDMNRLVDYNCEQCMNELRQVVVTVGIKWDL